MANVLVVDDSADIRELLALVLEASGHEARTASNGREALELVSERTPDLALLDVTMPVLNGPDTAYELFLRDCGLEDIPIVLVSGVVGLEEMAGLVGTPYFVSKPFSVEALMRVVQRALLERVPPRPAMEAR
jgi:CheY-like chemotaxis protein